MEAEVQRACARVPRREEGRGPDDMSSAFQACRPDRGARGPWAWVDEQVYAAIPRLQREGAAERTALEHWLRVARPCLPMLGFQSVCLLTHGIIGMYG